MALSQKHMPIHANGLVLLASKMEIFSGVIQWKNRQKHAETMVFHCFFYILLVILPSKSLRKAMVSPGSGAVHHRSEIRAGRGWSRHFRHGDYQLGQPILYHISAHILGVYMGISSDIGLFCAVGTSN